MSLKQGTSPTRPTLSPEKFRKSPPSRSAIAVDEDRDAIAVDEDEDEHVAVDAIVAVACDDSVVASAFGVATALCAAAFRAGAPVGVATASVSAP